MSWRHVYGSKRAQNKRFIQLQLDRAGLNQRMVAELADVTRQTVSQTLNGLIHSQKVLDVLREIGIAESVLFDPCKAPVEGFEFLKSSLAERRNLLNQSPARVAIESDHDGGDKKNIALGAF